MNSNKKNIKISIFLRLISLVILLVSFTIPLCPAITMTSNGVNKTYGPCYSFIFGGKINSSNISYGAKGLSGLAMAGLIILIISFIIICISFFMKDAIVKRPLFVFIGSLMIIISSIIFASLHRNFSGILADSLINGHSDAVSNTIYNNTYMEFGVWGITFFGFISSFLLLASLLFDGTFDRVRTKFGLI